MTLAEYLYRKRLRFWVVEEGSTEGNISGFVIIIIGDDIVSAGSLLLLEKIHGCSY